MVVHLVCRGAIFRTQRNWRGGLKRRSSSRGGTDPFRIAWPLDIERTSAPDPLEERAVLRLRQTKRYASRVREAHFPGIDRRMLCLLGVGTLQQESGRACVPEVSAKEQALDGVVVEYGE